jgi:hypothetical protein
MTNTKTPRRSPTTNHNGKLDRPSVVKEIEAVMRTQCPGDGVDRLLTRPIDTAMMMLQVARSKTSVPHQQLDAAVTLLETFRCECGGAIAAINGICRIAMNARKQGKLHPHAPSLATKAAKTRKDRETKGAK